MFELKYAAGTWSYSPVFYQPGTPLRYYSMYPESGAISTMMPAVDDFSFDYTVINDPADQEDLIGASVNATLAEQIDLQFNHLLSQVNFAVQGIPAASIVIGDIEVESVKNSGTYSFNDGWGTLDGAADYTYAPDGDVLDRLAAGQGSGIEYLITDENALMLMPQVFAAEADGTFSFTFSLAVDLDGDGDFADDGDSPEGARIWAEDVDVVVNFSDFDTKTWLPGKRYVYLIDFSSYIAGGPITFTVVVNDWEDAEINEDYAQTIHVAYANTQSVEAAIALHSDANAANDDLATFPINIPTAIAAFDITKIYGYDEDDVIRIECMDATEAAKVTLDASVKGWTRTVSGRVVILTCTTPTIKGASEAAGTADADGIELAIAALGAAPTADVYTEYTVTVSGSIAAAADLVYITGTYAEGDCIRILCADAGSAGFVTVSAADWTAVVVNGTEVLLTYEP